MWLKIDDGYAEHPKIEAAVAECGPVAMLIHVRLMCYCARNRTDGFVPDSALARIVADQRHGRKAARSLTSNGLILPAKAGVMLHDWLRYNPRAEDEAKEAEARSNRARKAAQARWSAEGDAQGNASSNAPSKCSGNAPVPSRPIRSNKTVPLRQSATAGARHPEGNPHPPSEPPPPEIRTPAAAQHDELTAWVIRRLRQARGGTDESRPPTQAEIRRLAQLIRPLGGKALQVVERYAEDEHPSTAAKTVRELLGCWDRMRGLVDRPPPKRADDEMQKTLALGKSDGREKPLTDAERQMLTDCACGHQGMKHRGATGGGACRICECERFTRTGPEPSTSDAGPHDTEPARAAGRSR